MNLKKSGDCPMNRPMSVKNLSAPIAAPLVSVGRITEQLGSFRLRNGQGSGMIKLVVKSSPPNGGALRSGKGNPLVEAVSGGASPAKSDQVWKCIVSVGPMLIRIRSTSTLLALCANDG